MKKPIKITIEGDLSKFNKTKFSINDMEIPLDSIYIVGDRKQDTDVIICLAIGKHNEEQEVIQERTPAIGFIQQKEYYDDE